MQGQATEDPYHAFHYAVLTVAAADDIFSHEQKVIFSLNLVTHLRIYVFFYITIACKRTPKFNYTFIFACVSVVNAWLELETLLGFPTLKVSHRFGNS